MCGFLTEFHFNSHCLTDEVRFAELLALSKHRGPDSTVVVRENNYQMGFNRLAILDLSPNGNQPKYSPSKRYHVVFNGELYNFKVLQEQYQLTNLQSTSDTEVLVHLLDVLGITETLKALNGMFAVVIMDKHTQTTYLARDFAGIKPLFYGLNDKGVVAASQFNQVFQHDWFKGDLTLRPDVVKDYFGFGYMQAPNTLYKDIYQVEPGTCVHVGKSGTIGQFSFCQFDTGHQVNQAPQVLKTVEQYLKDAVERQLVSDVPLASFLSGGIDSPLITAIAKQHKPELKAFTLSVEDKRLDESLQASQYAEQLGIDHTVYRITESTMLGEMDHHFKGMTEPLGDFSSIPTYVITKSASQDHTVMLSGDGGDELFYGYPRMLDVLQKRWWFNIPFSIRKPMVRLANKLKLSNTWTPYHYKTLEDFIKAKHTYVFKTDLDAFFDKAVDFSQPIHNLYAVDSQVSTTELLKALQQQEFYGHLQRVLKKVDLMSMANSMEVRVPFLDKHTIAAAFQYQPKTFKTTADLKPVLKKLMSRYFDVKTINDTKQGFTVPLYQWLHGDLKPDVERVVFNVPIYGSSCIKADAVKGFVKRFYDKQHHNDWGVWHIYAWQKWAIGQGLV